jgi:hypothetical protein
LNLTPEIIDSLLRLSARDPLFIGHDLAAQRIAGDLTPEQQAQRLGVTVQTLARLALCRVPDPENRAADLSRVSGYVGLPVDSLEAILAGRQPGEMLIDLDAPEQGDDPL